jgi:hypothetical protein
MIEPEMWLWLGLGGVWWLAALATTIPYRRRHFGWIRWLRLTVGLPLVMASLLARRVSRSGPGSPLRDFAPLWMSLVWAEGLTLLAWGLRRLLF